MVWKYIKIFQLLLTINILIIFQIKVINGKNIKNLQEKSNLRFLWEENIEYDTTYRDSEELESIQHCKDSDYKYFIQYVTGHNVTFDKNYSSKDIVSFF